MQPDRNPTESPLPQEPVQPPQTPYAAPATEMPRPAPVVTLTPDQSAVPVAPSSSLAAEELEQPSASVPALTQPTPQQEAEPVRWQAHEYIHHDRSPVWFVLFAIVVIGLIAAAIFLIQSVTFAILIPVMAAALLVYTHRPPRILDYTLSRQGLHVNDHLYAFAEFKGFGVIHDGAEYSVMLIPTKRFRPGVSVYFPEEAGEAIVDTLGARLPMQELHLDLVDKIIRKLRI